MYISISIWAFTSQHSCCHCSSSLQQYSDDAALQRSPADPAVNYVSTPYFQYIIKPWSRSVQWSHDAWQAFQTCLVQCTSLQTENMNIWTNCVFRREYWKDHLEIGINSSSGRIFSVASPGVSVQSACSNMITLLAEDVPHLHERVRRGVPVSGQLVLSHGSLITVQTSLHISRAKQRATENEN